MRGNRSAAGVALGLIVLATGTGVALAATGKAHGGAVVVLARDKGVTFAPNRFIRDTMFFAPGTLTVRSGQSVTFEFGEPNSDEPHTLALVKQSQLPRTGAQVENCGACEQYATAHLKNPQAPPDQNNPIVHWTLDKGRPGLDAVGDSVAIQEPGAHKSITVKVSAPAGSTLYFVCAVHPWMQGKILVR